ncbi:MAG TPA: hypothetical protein VM597_24875 [Gemmataceae bacterium]|jgi:hypothetical protein|nr:hypothetical protein [Gemmataceae bacterium]
MDHILVAAGAALVLLATLFAPRLAGDWLTWPGTSHRIGRLSRLGLGVM